MNLPVVPYGVTNLSGLIEWLRTLAASIAVGWGQEHNSDGTHGVIHERGRTVAIGEWIKVPFSAGNFTGNGAMTWTVDSDDVLQNTYTLFGATLVWSLRVVTSSVGGTPNTRLLIGIPGGFVIAPGTNIILPCGRVLDNAVVEDSVFVQANTAISTTQVAISKQALTNWASSTNQTEVSFQVALEVQ